MSCFSGCSRRLSGKAAARNISPPSPQRAKTRFIPSEGLLRPRVARARGSFQPPCSLFNILIIPLDSPWLQDKYRAWRSLSRVHGEHARGRWDFESLD